MAIPSVLRTALTAILAALRGINGAGDYNHDLSSDPTQRVQSHEPNPFTIAGTLVFVRAISETSDVRGVPLGYHERSVDLVLACYAGGTGDPDTELYEVMDLVSDVDRCLMAQRDNANSDLMGAILDVYRTATSITSRSSGPGVYGEAEVAYRLTWLSTNAGGF